MILTEEEKKRLIKKCAGKSLADLYPILADEWGDNGDLTPFMVTPSNPSKVQWKLGYDDAQTGKHFDFVWEASINSRVYAGRGCPYLLNQAAWEGYNDLATRNPELAREWHPTKNNGLKPEDVVYGSTRTVWWLLPYDDPKTGKHFDFEWQAKINSRVSGARCPFLLNQAVWKGYNDLATTNPELAKEWHPTKNGALTPQDITSGSGKKIWWFLPYDDPETGKHFDFEWQSRIVDRINGKGCPYLSVNAKNVWPGFNDLATTDPGLASEWNAEKNNNLLPTEVSASSGKKVWWKCRYGHEWKAAIYSRSQGTGCPTCGKESQTSFPEQVVFYYCQKYFEDAVNRSNDIGCEVDVYIPSKKTAIEYDGVAWHKDKEREEIEKNLLLQHKQVHLIRIRERGLSDIGGSENYLLTKRLKQYTELENVIYQILSNLGIKLDRKDICVEKERGHIYDFTMSRQKENSLLSTYPDVAEEWDYEKNIASPDMFLPISNHKVWWICPKGHSYQAKISHRTVGGTGCPYCSNQKVLKGFNDLKSVRPDIAKEWHPTKNEGLKPDGVVFTSPRKVWWLLPYDDSKTGKHFDFEWQCEIRQRTVYDASCPFLSGNQVYEGFNDLRTTNPELAAQWHPTKNKGLKPENVTAGSGKKVWWLFPYDDPKTGKHFDFEWQANVFSRVNGNGVPFLNNKKAWPGYNDLETTNPEIAQDWLFEKNGNITPQSVTSKSGKKVWWKCKCCGDVKQTKVVNRTLNGGCLLCKKKLFGTKPNPRSKEVICLETGEVYANATECARQIGSYRSNIDRACKKHISALGKHYKYVDDPITLSEILGKPKTAAKRVRCIETGMIFDSLGECAKYFGLKGVGNISSVCRGKQKTVKGFHLEYYTDE